MPGHDPAPAHTATRHKRNKHNNQPPPPQGAAVSRCAQNNNTTNTPTPLPHPSTNKGRRNKAPRTGGDARVHYPHLKQQPRQPPTHQTSPHEPAHLTNGMAGTKNPPHPPTTTRTNRATTGSGVR